MKKLLIMSALGVLLASSCTTSPPLTKEENEQMKRDLYCCDEIPQEIKEVSAGQYIYWDCRWQRSYNSGEVDIIVGDDGKLTALIRNIPNL